MEANAAATLEAHVETCITGDWESLLASFNDFLINRTHTLLPAHLYERIKDLFILEKTRSAFLAAEKRSGYRVYIDCLLHQDKVMEQLSHPDQWLLERQVQIAPSVFIATSKWDWSFQQDWKKMEQDRMHQKQLQNLTLPPGEFYYLFQVFARLEVVEFPLAVALTQILHFLREPRNVGEAFRDIQRFFSSMPLSMVKGIFPELNNIPPASINDLFKELDRIILSQVRMLLYRKILVLVN